MIVRELVTRFGFNIDTAGQNRVESSIDRLSGMLQGLAAFASLRALAGVADSMQSLEARIGMLPQTIGDVGDAFNTISQRASNAKQSIDAYGSFYVKAGNATQDFISSQDELLRVVDGAAFGLAASGATAAGQSQAFFQLGQAIASPIVQMEEMNTLIDVAPDLFRELGRVIPGANGNLKKFIGTGQVTGKMLAEGLVKAADIFEEKMRKMPMSIGTATTLISNRFSTMVQNMNRESQVVTTVANFLLDGFAMVERGAQRFIDFVGGNTNALKTLGIALAALLGPMALAGLVSVLGAVFSVGGLVIGGLILLGLVIDDIVTGLNGGQSVFGDFLSWMREGSVGASAFQGALIALGAGLALYAVSLGAVAKAWILVKYSAMRAQIVMAATWLAALGPMALVLAGIAAVSAAILYMYNNWEKVKGFFVQLVGGGAPSVPSVGAGAVAGASAGGGTTVDARQTVNLTVPAGTPESQQAFLKNAAAAAMGEGMEKKIARDMAMAGGF